MFWNKFCVHVDYLFGNSCFMIICESVCAVDVLCSICVLFVTFGVLLMCFVWFCLYFVCRCCNCRVSRDLLMVLYYCHALVYASCVLHVFVLFPCDFCVMYIECHRRVVFSMVPRVSYMCWCCFWWGVLFVLCCFVLLLPRVCFEFMCCWCCVSFFVRMCCYVSALVLMVLLLSSSFASCCLAPRTGIDRNWRELSGFERTHGN